VVTTTHCLDRGALRATAASIAANDMIRDGKLTTAQKTDFVNEMRQTAEFTGPSPQSAPSLIAKAQLYTAITGSADAKTIPVTVVDSQPTAADETTLVKLDRSGLPVAQLADVPRSTGSRVVEIGFGTDDASTPKVSYTIRFKGATMAGDYGNGTPPKYQLDGDLGANAHGGMVTDLDGKVVGMITADTAADDKSNRIVTPTSTIVKLLEANQVKNVLGPTDQTYRDGLNAYFGGHYTDAISKLDAVLALQPDNAVAQSYRKQAGDRLAIEGDAGAGTRRLTLILAIVVGVAVLSLMVVVVVVLLRGRRRKPPLMYFDPYALSSTGPISSGPPT
jgi:hypothetical protein